MLITKQEAKIQGLVRYFTGKPCAWGHIAERRVSDDHCITCSQITHKKWLNSNTGRMSRRKTEQPRRQRWRSQALARFNNKCSRCGESRRELLEFHHINGEGTVHRKQFSTSGTSKQYLKWIVRTPLEEVQKMLSLLCAGCHRNVK